MDYLLLEKISIENKKRICIFGAGKIGRTWAYDILTCAGFEVDCYCDNKLPTGKEIRDGIKTIDFDALCKNKENYLVFIAVNEKFQNEIKRQFDEEGMADYIMMGFLFLQEFCESVRASKDEVVLERYKIIVDDKEVLKKKFLQRVGYELDIDKPKTFNEKLQWLKLHDRNPKYTGLVDKYEFKKYIEAVLGEKYVIPTLGVWDSVEEIEWNKLPNKFVLKCTHDSGSVVICREKKDFDVNAAIEKLKICMKYNFYWRGREWPYKNVKPRIIMEPYLEDISGEMIDYKFMCYGGVCKYIFTCTERYEKTGLKVTFFDRDWNKLEIKRHYPPSERDIKRPLNFKQMLGMAEKISGGYPFVRIDFYEINKRIYVGEFTLYPGSGFEEFEKYEDDVLFGKDIICGG